MVTRVAGRASTMRAYPSLCATVLLAIAALLLAPYAADAKNVNAVATSSEFYWLPSSYGDCDVTCGSGLRTRAVECYSGETVSDDASCADLTKPDTVTGCTLADCFTYEWSSSSWSGCDNLECGSAYSSRSVQCVTSTGLSIESSYCDGSAPVESEICTASSASCAALTNATWNWGEWTSCSASCGTGHETRDRWCIDSSDEVVDDTSCDCDGLPTYRTCNLGDCETFSWSITTYADCSVTCGTGYRERTIVCTSSVRGTVDDAECASALSYSKPTEVVRCVADAECPTYEWVGQGFGDCSVTCGTGQATQSVLCINSVSKDTVAESYCTGSFPLTVKDCVESDCVTCDWSAGSYSECDVTCGLGEQIREVSCLCSDGSVDASLSTCAGTMPEALLSCGEPCPNCFYAPGAWGECSATCGSEGVETRDINCVCDGESADLSACSALVNTYDSSASCNVVSCPTYSWKQGGYGDCPVTCGTSYTYQTVTCVSDLTGEEVEATYCDDTKPSTVSTCAAASACQSYHWSAGEFGSCTASCGNGYYTRKVWCENNVGVTVDDSLCSGTAPDATSICNEGACETYTWAHDSWSDCSATCRGGVATRTVTCVSSQRGVVANSHCDTDSQPAAIEGCNFDVKCPKYGWISYGWSACSASCGAGTMTQTLGCKNYRGAVMVDDSFCANLSVPTTVQVCSAMACEVYEWSESSLGDCSVTCGKGIATRTVHCQGQLYGTIDYTSTMCTGARPSETEDCDMTSCPTYSWSVGSFGDCSSTCDEGTQTRTVYCLSSDGSSVDDSFCAASVTKPDLTKTCNFGACQSINYITTYEYVTGSFGDCSVTCGNGIELRTVQCEQITTVITNGESSSTTAWVEDSYCSELTRPSCHQSCATGVDCQGPTWSVVPSDVCSASCGSGYTTSSVTCKTVSGETVDDSLCDADSQPTSQESCNYGPCETFEWTTGSYSDCSVTCGTGIKTREVYCTSSQRGQVASSYCSGSAPTDHQVCESGVECVWCDWVPGSWSDCSATCGLGLNTRSVECLCSDGTTSETACELLTAYTSERVCSYGGSCETYSWSVGSYSDECSVTCGEGVMTRTASCVGSLGSVDETGVQCHELDTPITSKACSKAECEIFEYVYGKTWGECDVTCGFGTQTRTVSCVGSYGTVDETLEQCVSLTLLPTSRDCFPTTCEVCSWQVGSLADCSVTCGDGIETREVACVGNRGTVCDASECDGDAPEATVTCAMACCTTYSWYVGRYGDCSTTCGTGTKSREVFCHDNEGLVVDASYCDGSSPAVDETCETGVACTGPSWSNGDWSDCSASCGSGTRSRSVYCLAVDGSVLEDSECSGSAPAASEDCNLCSCETTEWEVSSWSECSVTCGTGFQTRSIECRSTLRGYVGASECSGTELADHQACSTTCYGWMAGEYGTCTDGVQTRNIYCVGTDASVDSTGDNCEGSQPSDSAVC